MKNQLQKTDRDFEYKSHEQLKMLFPAVVLALWNQKDGWRHKRIDRVFDEAENVWQECADGYRSLLEIMEDETGIEMRLPGTNKSYKDIWWLNSKLRARKLTPAQTILVRKQQLIWQPTMILSTVCLALYRKYGWNVVRLSRLIGNVQDMYMDIGPDTGKLMEEQTDYTLAELTDKYISATYRRSK